MVATSRPAGPPDPGLISPRREGNLFELQILLDASSAADGLITGLCVRLKLMLEGSCDHEG
jgi:hypothetical protein